MSGPPTPLRRPLRDAAAAAVLAVLAATAVAAAPTRYLAFGDSVTAGVGFDDCTCQCPEQCGYARRLQTDLRGEGVELVVVNEGLGGEETPGGLTRLDEVLASVGGDVLLLMEGTNDIGHSISLETTLFNLGEMARKAAERGMATVHATLIPRSPTATLDPENALTERLAWGIRELAFRAGRPLVDPFEVFSSTPDVFATRYANAPGDPVGHPNALGYDLLAATFADVLAGRDTVPPVPGYVSPFDGAVEVSPDAEILLRLYDFGSGIDVGATRLLVDGVDVPFTTQGSAARLELAFRAPGPLAGTVTVGVVSRDRAPQVNAVSRELAAFTIAGGPLPTLTSDEMTHDRRRLAAGRKQLLPTAPSSSHPTLTILTPGRAGALFLTTHTAQHDRRGVDALAPESRLAYLLHHTSFAQRDSREARPMVALLAVPGGSDVVAAGAAGEIEAAIDNGQGKRLTVSNRADGPALDALPAGALEAALSSTHEHKLTGRDRLVFDRLHEILSVKLCDDVSGGRTTCYDAYLEAFRRSPVDRYQLSIGCVDPALGCGEAVVNLRVNYNAEGLLNRGVIDLELDDPRFTLHKELVVSVKAPTAPGVLWSAAAARLVLDDAGSTSSDTFFFDDLYHDADPSRLDPGVD